MHRPDSIGASPTRSTRGLTLIELMITLVIAAGLLSLGIITLRGYIPKQRLLSSVSTMENLLQRAQSEAMSRSSWTCIEFTGTSEQGIKAWLFVDENANHGASDACGDTGTTDDILIQAPQLRKDIDLPDCGGLNVAPACKIWFDSTGSPKKCAPVNCPGDPSSGCVDDTYEIVLTHTDLDSGTKAREVEALSGGLIATVKPGEKGLATDLWALGPAGTPAADNVAGNCE